MPNIPISKKLKNEVFLTREPSIRSHLTEVKDEMCVALLTVVGQTVGPVAACIQVGPGHHRCKTPALPGHTTIDPEFTANASTYEGGEDFKPLGHAGRMVPVSDQWFGKYRDSNFKAFNKTEQLLKEERAAVTCSAWLQKEQEASPLNVGQGWSFASSESDAGCNIRGSNASGLVSKANGSASSASALVSKANGSASGSCTQSMRGMLVVLFFMFHLM